MIFLLTAAIPATEYVGDSFDESKFNQCAPSEQPFKHGEELTYVLYYSLPPLKLSAGEVTFRLEEEGDSYRLTAKGKTYSGYEWFFKVDDYYETEVDKLTLLPRHSIRDISEGDYNMYEEVDFDIDNKKVNVQRGTNHFDLDNGEDFEIENCVSDVLSLLYVLRTANVDNMKVGEEVPMSLFIDKEEFNLKMTYKGKNSNKKIPGMGRYKTKVFEPEVVKGTVFKGDSGMKVWVSDDANRIPMMIKAPVSVGSIKAVIKSYKNLKY